MPVEYRWPTHIGYVVSPGMSKVKVSLTELKDHWATRSKVCYRKDTGVQRGAGADAICRLDISSVIPIAERKG